MASNINIKEITAGLCVSDADRFSVTLMEAVNFKSPYAINKAFSQVGAAEVIRDFVGDIPSNYDFLKLDKDTRKRIVAFADLYKKISPNISLDGMKIDRAIKRGDVAAIEKEYSKALSEYVAKKVMQKISPNILKVYSCEPRKDKIKNFLYGMIAVNDTSRWQEFLSSQLGSGRYDPRKVDAFYEDFLGEYFNGVILPNRDERVAKYKRFLASNNSLDYVDSRVDKYADLLIEEYRKDFGKGTTLTQINEFANENKDIIVRNFGQLINFLDDNYVRYNFIQPVMDKFRQYVHTHEVSAHEDEGTLKYIKLKDFGLKKVLENTPARADKPTFESLVDRAKAKHEIKVKPFFLKNPNPDFTDEDVLDYVQDKIDATATDDYIGILDSKFINNRHKREIVLMLADSGYDDDEAVKKIRKVVNTDKSM